MQAVTDIQKLNDRLGNASVALREVRDELHVAGIHVAASDPLAVALTSCTRIEETLRASLQQLQSHLTHRITFGGEQ